MTSPDDKMDRTNFGNDLLELLKQDGLLHLPAGQGNAVVESIAHWVETGDPDALPFISAVFFSDDGLKVLTSGGQPIIRERVLSEVGSPNPQQELTDLANEVGANPVTRRHSDRAALVGAHTYTRRPDLQALELVFLYSVPPDSLPSLDWISVNEALCQGSQFQTQVVRNAHDAMKIMVRTTTVSDSQ